MEIGPNSVKSRRIPGRFTVMAACLGATLCFASPARVQAQTTMVVANLGGVLGETLREVYVPFEKQFNVKIRWVAGANAAENVARIAATKDKPEFDVIIGEGIANYTGSTQGLWAKIDPSIVTNYKDVIPQGKTPNNDIVVYGIYLTGLFYADKEFEKRGWKAPTKWMDLFRPEFCGRIGIFHPNVSYGLFPVLMLGGGNPKTFSDGVDRLAANKKCITRLEPTVAQLDEKMQLGEYLIGAHGNIRTIPLVRKGAPVKFVIPEDGGVIGLSALSPVKNAPNPRLAQEFSNWALRPDVQLKIMEKLFTSPTNKNVSVPKEYLDLGVPDFKALERSVNIAPDVLSANRRLWIRQIERAMEN